MDRVQKCVISTKLIEILIGSRVNEEDLDSIISRVKTHVSSDIHERRKKSLVNLFDLQLKRLYELGCPEDIIGALEQKKQRVILNAGYTGKGNIPFLPVIPKECMGMSSLMAMVKNESGFEGMFPLDQNKITNAIEVPEEPYYILNVSRKERAHPGHHAVKGRYCTTDHRSFLTAEEIIALVLQRQSGIVMSDFDHICALISKYDEGETIGFFSQHLDGCPHLINVAENDCEGWKIPACRREPGL